MFVKKGKIYKKFFTARCLTIGCMMILLLFSVNTFAKNLSEYKSDLETLRKTLDSITTEDVSEEYIDDVLKKAPQTFPTDEEIEFGDTKINLNNEWLIIEIAKYNSATDEEEKLRILTGIKERLDAILIKIDEMDSAEEGILVKDEEKRKLADILKREEFQKPLEQEKSLFQRFVEWLESFFQKDPDKAESEILQLPTNSFGSVVYFFQLLVYGILIAGIGFLIYKFAPFFIKKFREREKREKKERIILGEKISADETSENLFREAEKLAEAGNLKDAIRKGYIAFLFELSERKLIGLAKHRTNRDYLLAVKKKRNLYENMGELTLNFERHCYGFDEADEADWQAFRKDYNQALKQ